jgi:hypothetical protein
MIWKAVVAGLQLAVRAQCSGRRSSSAAKLCVAAAVSQKLWLCLHTPEHARQMCEGESKTCRFAGVLVHVYICWVCATVIVTV